MTGQRWGVLVPKLFQPDLDIADFMAFERFDSGKVKAYKTMKRAAKRVAELRKKANHPDAAKPAPLSPEIEARYGVEVVE